MHWVVAKGRNWNAARFNLFAVLSGSGTSCISSGKTERSWPTSLIDIYEMDETGKRLIDSVNHPDPVLCKMPFLRRRITFSRICYSLSHALIIAQVMVWLILDLTLLSVLNELISYGQMVKRESVFFAGGKDELPL